MKKNNKKQGSGTAVGVALAAVAAAAGAYFLYGTKDAKKNRKKVRGWALKAKGEVVEKLEKIKGEINEENYNEIVESVLSKYEKVKDIAAPEIELVGKELKGHWKNIKKHLK